MKSIKKFTIFAGVNGAGKSTLFSTEAEDNLGIRLNGFQRTDSRGETTLAIAKRLFGKRSFL